MRYIYISAFVFLCSLNFLNAQIPNAGFEDWTSGEPNNWLTNNADPYITVTQSNSSHSGLSALKGAAINYIPPFLPVMGPVAFCEGADGYGFPIEGRFNSLKGFYKFNQQGGDQIVVTVVVSLDTVGIGAGSIVLNAAASYAEFGVPITYIDPATPNRCYVAIQMTNPIGGIIATLGSEIYIDDLQLSMDFVSDVKDEFQISKFELSQNYPNPFNPSTRIQYQVSSNSQVSLKVYDVLGNEVATLVNEEKPTGVYEVNFDASQLSSGIYFYKLNAANYSETKKMILMR